MIVIFALTTVQEHFSSPCVRTFELVVVGEQSKQGNIKVFLPSCDKSKQECPIQFCTMRLYKVEAEFETVYSESERDKRERNYLGDRWAWWAIAHPDFGTLEGAALLLAHPDFGSYLRP